MGVDAVITVVSPGERRKKKRSPNLPQFDLAREWNELDAALQAFESPTCLAIRGKPTWEDDEDFDWVVITPALAKKVAAALGKIPDESLLKAVHANRRETGWRLRKYEHKSVIAAFETLKDAYRLAARKGAYLEIIFF